MRLMKPKQTWMCFGCPDGCYKLEEIKPQIESVCVKQRVDREVTRYIQQGRHGAHESRDGSSGGGISKINGHDERVFVDGKVDLYTPDGTYLFSVAQDGDHHPAYVQGP